MEEIYQGDFTKAFQDYLRASYVYYILEEESIFNDSYYDYLCRYLLTGLDKIDKVYEKLVCEDSLRCGSGYHIKAGDYPDGCTVKS